MKKIEYIYLNLSSNYNIFSLNSVISNNKKTLKVQFIYESIEKTDSNTKNINHSNIDVHSSVIEIITILRKIFPTYEAYGSQAYGHNFGDLIHLPFDESIKEGISISSLHPRWLTGLNVLAHGLSKNILRPDTWKEYIENSVNMRSSIVSILTQLSTALKKYHRQNKKGKSDIFQNNINTDDWESTKILTSDRDMLPKIAVDKWGYSHESQSHVVDSISIQDQIMPRSIIARRMKPYLKSKQQYTSSINNFLTQSIDVITTNVRISHLKPSDTRRISIIKGLNALGVRSDLTNIATHNFYDARKRLLEYQKQYKTIFENIISDSETKELTKKENETLDQLWHLWYFFAFEPHNKWSDPIKQTTNQFRIKNQDIKSKIHIGIKNSTKEGVNISIIDSVNSWKGDSAFWIKINTNDPKYIYHEAENLIINIKQSIGKIDYNTIYSYIIEEAYYNIVIVPTVRDQSMDQSAWILSTRGAIMEYDSDDTDNLWRFIPQFIPDETWSKLDIRIIDMVDANTAILMAQSMKEVLLLSHQINSIKERNYILGGDHVIEEFIERRVKIINEKLKYIYHSISEITVNSQPVSTIQAQNEDFITSIDILKSFMKTTKQFEYFTNEYSAEINIDSIPDYIKYFEEMNQTLDLFKRHWLSYILETDHTKMNQS